jgi:hypothetical protein
MAKRSYIDGDVRDAIVVLALEKPGWNATDIHRALQQDERVAGRLPTVRTVQSMVKDARPRDASGPWSLADGDVSGADAALILPVLAAVVREREGHVPGVTRREAAWIVKLRRAVPDLPPWETYRLARRYLVREDRKEPCMDLDLFLAFAPWRDEAAAQAYATAVTGLPLPLPAGSYRPVVQYVHVNEQTGETRRWRHGVEQTEQGEGDEHTTGQ